VAARPITFLSDYGYEDEFAGVCRALIARVAPEARLIDLTHGVPRHDVRHGALALADAVAYAPAGVHLAVVDPGVGTQRRAVAIRVATEDRVLVGPDNGVLWPAVEALGGALEVVELDRSPFRIEPVSATFHGRDVFAPAAAVLALGAALADVGHPVEPGSLARLHLPSPHSDPDRLAVNILHLDRFGNATLSASARDLAGGTLRPGYPLSVEVGGRSLGATFARTFADVGKGDVLVFEDSSGRLALAVNRGSAAEMLEVVPGDEVAIVVAR
jgi:S-adenosyl-L-methionine hydrolase (adenosine-forming)